MHYKTVNYTRSMNASSGKHVESRRKKNKCSCPLFWPVSLSTLAFPFPPNRFPSNGLFAFRLPMLLDKNLNAVP